MDWDDWWKASCLVLLLEGISLFMLPGQMRAGARLLAGMSDRTLRVAGLVTMLLGLGLLMAVGQ